MVTFTRQPIRRVDPRQTLAPSQASIVYASSAAWGTEYSLITSIPTEPGRTPL